jgi:hypothetical protein
MSLPTPEEALAEIKRQRATYVPPDLGDITDVHERIIAMYDAALQKIAKGELTRNKLAELARGALQRGKPYREAMRKYADARGTIK